MMTTADDQIEYLPLFVYGTLLERTTRDSVLGPSVLRTERAVARGRWEDVADYPAACFRDPVSEISGELVWLAPGRLEGSLQRADRYEGADIAWPPWCWDWDSEWPERRLRRQKARGYSSQLHTLMPNGAPVTEYRASFDATIRFSNGGDLTAHGFRVDVPSPDIDEDDIAALFVASLGLLMTDSVRLTNVEIFAEPHKGTRGGPSDHSHGGRPAGGRLIELSHVIRAGMVTYPGLPGPEITPYLTRDASREHYAPGTEFAIDRLSLLGNTGTYLEAPITVTPMART
jgi:hypothetical protein